MKEGRIGCWGVACPVGEEEDRVSTLKGGNYHSILI